MFLMWQNSCKSKVRARESAPPETATASFAGISFVEKISSTLAEKISDFMLRILLTLFVITCINSNSYAKEDIVSLSEYLNQVKNQNLTYDAAAQNAAAYELLKKKADLVTAIKLYGSSEKATVKQNQTLQIFRYHELSTQTNRVGFTQTSDFGLNTNVHYSMINTLYRGLDTSALPDPNLAKHNYQSIPTVEMSVPLWQNRLGSSTKATKDSTYFANESQKLTARSLSANELANAEKTYWSLVYTRKAVKIQRRALKSAKKILDYVLKREKMNLGNKADVLQARASFESKKLLLKQAENDEKIAVKLFNKQRNLALDHRIKKLEDFNLSKLQTFRVPKVKASDRFDIKASKAKMKAAVASAKIEEENNKPSLSLYGSYSLTQVKNNPQRAFYNSLAPNGIGTKIGLEFSLPINFGLTSDIQQGALKTASAAKITYRQQLLDQENDWQSLVQNMRSYRENLKLSLALEEAQKEKLENEIIRLEQGRTNTYQVLLFEQDFSNAELQTQQIAYRLLDMIATSRLYQN